MEKELEIEFETVQLQIPKAVMDLIKAFRNDIDDYLRESILSQLRADLESDLPDNGAIVSREILIDKYNLKDILYNDC
jgi:hypothetical protein